MALSVTDIRSLFEQYGDIAYSGEPVTQLQHALQSGALAEEAGAGDELVAASFLHDLGHLLNLQGATPTERGIDDLHQYFALPFLRAVLPDAVLEPIRLRRRKALPLRDRPRLFRSAFRRFGAEPESARRHLQQRGSGEISAETVRARRAPAAQVG